MIRLQTRLALAIIALASLTPADAADPSVPAADAAAIDRAGERGRLIYAYQAAGLIASQDAITKLPDARAKIGGWIVEGPAEAARVTFYDRAGPSKAVYLVSIVKGQPLGGHPANGGEQEFKPAQLAQIAALRSAKAAFTASGSQNCAAGQAFRSVVLPPSAPGDPHLVYYLTAQTQPDIYPIGGNYRIEVSAKGVAGPVHSFTVGCPVANGKEANGAKAQAIFITQPVDPLPNEIHVLAMYATGVPLIVGTVVNKKSWLINQGADATQIRVVTARVK